MIRDETSGRKIGGAALGWLIPGILLWAMLGLASALGQPRFVASDIEGQGATVLYADLDGDRLTDLVLIDGAELAIYYQDARKGFTRQPQRKYHLGAKPTIIWAAKLGKSSDSLLCLNHDGVTELCFTNRAEPTFKQTLISQVLDVPETLDELSAVVVPLSAAAAGAWPLLLVPVQDGLQVWQHRQEWCPIQTLAGALDTRVWPILSNPGYNQTTDLRFGQGDLNGDQRDDLILMHNQVTGKQTYDIYLQEADGHFTLQPAATYTDQFDWRSWLCWVDINRDGQVDLIKTTWLDEPWFLPGMRSGKVVVGTYLADAQGRISSEPRQIFRKNDWMAAIPIIDLDGDGFMDLVLGYSLFDSREGARKMITAKQLDFNLKFHCYRPGVGFPKEPDCQRDIIIHLDQHSLHLSWSRREYFENLVSLNGDFNGDGKRDLLVRDHSDQVSVYFFVSRSKGFHEKVDLKFACAEPMAALEAKDLNQDGISDLIIRLQKRKAIRIYTSENR